MVQQVDIVEGGKSCALVSACHIRLDCVVENDHSDLITNDIKSRLVSERITAPIVYYNLH
jgi:hypothetical protein